MSLDNIATISDILTTLQGIEGLNQKAELVSILTPKGVSVNTSMDMATVINSVNNLKTLEGCTAGDTVILVSASELYTSNLTATNLKEMQIYFNGTIRVRFSVKSDSASIPAVGKVYKNGVQIGTTRSNGSVSYVEYSEDFTVSKNDLIQIYCNTSAGGYKCYVKDFKISVGSNLPYGAITLGGN